ncbi:MULTISPECIES: hypothetical protein [unclassified Microbacterium]|uniref:hypothetical protein n=1 Tax=unclassified Microbacterium TaxID=2609290 RepID=UPI000D56D514|nr:hypothetical protein [Microbacterium sp. Gd 4-13]PVW06409.1 hypothetical protein DEA06_02475 [Microbacterium sp. Gd 4-13]
MNDLVSPVRSTDRAEHDLLRAVVHPGVRISLVDRLSLRLGLWLLLRSTRRIHRVRDHADHARLLALHRAEQERARADAWTQFDRRRPF